MLQKVKFTCPLGKGVLYSPDALLVLGGGFGIKSAHMFPSHVATTPPAGDRNSLNAQRGATKHNKAKNPLGSCIVSQFFTMFA